MHWLHKCKKENYAIELGREFNLQFNDHKKPKETKTTPVTADLNQPFHCIEDI